MMNRLHCLTGILLLGLLMTACAPQKRLWYLQDVTPQTPEQIAQNGQIRIKPLDRLTIVVNSQDPELAVPFNTSSTFSSLSGTPSTTSGKESLQIYTVDENGRIAMPVIGVIDCEGLTRTELADRIARKIIDGGYIINTYTSLINDFFSQNTTAAGMTPYKEQMEQALEQLSKFTPIDITMQIFSNNIFWGILLAIPTALFAMKKNNGANPIQF